METFPLQFTPKAIDQAGRILVQVPPVDEPEWLEAARLVNEWRASHSGPLNTFRMNLGRRVGDSGIVAQRLKRLPSITAKLARLRRIRLSRMQDIGGCRAIVGEATDAFDLANELAESRIRHELVRSNNYIDRPRASGYRSLHLVYAYNSERSTRWQGLNIEVQIRSELQHQWATAVETVGTFIGDELKASSGDQTWLRFFALMSSVIAQREGTPSVPDTPANRRELVEEIEECDRLLGVSERLAFFQDLTLRLHGIRRIRNHWVVLELNLETNHVTGLAFNASELAYATSRYLDMELKNRGNPRMEVVLVSASSLSALRRAYPNYFADLERFRRLFQETVGNR